MRNLKNPVKRLLLLSVVCFSAVMPLSMGTFADALYPDLTPEYLRTFPQSSAVIIESSEGSDLVRVYDGEGKFLFVTNRGEQEHDDMVFSIMKQARSYLA